MVEACPVCGYLVCVTPERCKREWGYVLYEEASAGCDVRPWEDPEVEGWEDE